MESVLKSISSLNTLLCSACGKEYSHSYINTYATCCNAPLVAEYFIKKDFNKNSILYEKKNMWRYTKMLPVINEENIVSLGEGMTPILSLNKLSSAFNLSAILMKDESLNPTGSFKARGISVAVSKAKELGITKCIIPTAGNAGGALAAYCAKADIECTVVMPTHTPDIFKQECEIYGADLILVEGLINDCAKKTNELTERKKYFDISTLKEPYRLEGKKTMGYEIAEQLNWQLPDVIIYPAGGGTGLIGIWKAFKEMQKLGWIHGSLPRMMAVQSDNCAPLMYALKDPVNWKRNFSPKPSVANGLAVPYPFGMNMILRTLHESNGDVCSISDEEIISGVKEIARTEGILVSPEGAATWKGLLKFIELKKINPSEKILIINTGSGYKYLSNLF